MSELHERTNKNRVLHERTNKNRVLYDSDEHREENLMEEIFIGCSKDNAASEIDEEEEDEPLEVKRVTITHGQIHF